MPTLEETMRLQQARKSGDYSAVRRPPTPPRRYANPPGVQITRAILHRGAQPEDMLRAFEGAKLTQRQRQATQQLGELVTSKAREYAPKSASPITGGNMAAGIRLIRINANTVEIAAPPPALWRIRGFPDTSGLRPWLVKSTLSEHVYMASTRLASDIDKAYAKARAKDREEAVTAANQRIQRLNGLLIENQRKEESITREYHQSGVVLSAGEARMRRSELAVRAGNKEDESYRARGKAERIKMQAERRGKPPSKQQAAKMREHEAQAESLMAEAADFRRELERTKEGHILYPPEQTQRVLTEIPQLREHREKLAAQIKTEQFFGQLAAKGEHPPGRHAGAVAARVRHALRISSDAQLVNVPIYGTGMLETRQTNLERILAGAFRYPPGKDFLQQAVDDPEVQTLVKELQDQMAEAVFEGRG